MSELKPCAHCGNPAYCHVKYEIHSHKVRYVVKCTKCNAKMEYRNEQAAVSAWNRRVKENDDA